MRIAIIGEPYYTIPPRKYGGTERVIYYLIKGLKEAGHEPILLGTGDSTVDCQIIPIVDKALGFPATKEDVSAHNKAVKNALTKTTGQLKELLHEVDVIHSHGFDLLPFKDFPNVTTIHGDIKFDDFNYYSKRQDLFYVSISKNQQERYPSLKFVRAVYNGEDPELFPLNPEPSDYVCFLGRFDNEKNPHLAIEMAINFGIKIKLAGKIDFLGGNYFNENIKKYLSHPLVEYLGELNSKDSIKLLSDARVNLHPVGWREPFGLTVLEAAYCGTPTMAITRGSMPELIEEGKTGLLVEDFIEGYHHLGECFSMDREYIANRARKKFNYKNMSTGYIRAYRKVIKELSK
jgi:glycosyltransferase involved in cell wall biosynthesis